MANSVTATALQIITAALQEIGALAAGEVPSTDDSAWMLQKLQRLVDRYNAREPMVYNVNFTEFALPVGQSPVTIGPTGTFVVNQRPVKLDGCSLILNGGTDSANQVEIPMFVRDDAWWAQQSIKNLPSTLPTDVYYDPAWPNGNLYFWPVPTAINNVRLQLRAVLSEYTGYTQTFALPPAYWDAIVYELAISSGPSFAREPSQILLGLWKASIKAVEVNNISSPRLYSDAPSQTGTSRSRPDFNFLTGMSQ